MESTPYTQLPSYFQNNNLQSYTFYFDLDQDLPLKVNISLQPRSILEEALGQAIIKANELLSEKGVSLKRQLMFYKPRLAGKNFKPKTDMPGNFILTLSLYQKICDLKVNEIAIQILKKDEAIQTKTLPQKPQDTKQQTKPLLEANEEKQEDKAVKEISNLAINEGSSETK